MPKVLRQVLSLFLLIVFLSSIVMTLTRLQDPLPPWIVFTSARDGNHEIYRMRWDGSRQERLTHHPSSDRYPNWSPNGQWIWFTSLRANSRNLFRMRPNGHNQKQLYVPRERLVEIPSNWGSEWSPDGQWIVYGGGHGGIDIFRMRPDGSEQERLTESERENFSWSWSPDSQEIIFISTRNNRSQIYRMNLDGSNQEPISLQNDNFCCSYSTPIWSPDGQWILFSSFQEGIYMHDVYRMRPDGSELELFLSLGKFLNNLRWADHQHLIFSMSDQIGPNIYRYNIVTNELLRLTDTGNNFDPAPSPIIDLPWRGLVMLLSSALLLLLIAWQGRRSNQALTA